MGVAEAMKAKYKLEKRKRGYVIARIKDRWVCIATQLLVGKLMRKCHVNEVVASVIALAEQCVEEVQFNWAQFLCKEFLMNCKEAQDQGKTFHYVWLLLSILLIISELPTASLFPTIDRNLPKAVRYTSLWAMKDAAWIREIKVFWAFIKACL